MDPNPGAFRDSPQKHASEGDVAALFFPLTITQEALSPHEVEEAYRDHVNPSLLKILKLSGCAQMEESASGFWVKDHAGKTYLDFMGGFGVFSFGHRPAEVQRALKEQLEKIPLSTKLFLSEPLARLSRVLAAITPGALTYTFLCNSGSEAVEGALKFAMAATGRRRFVALNRAYHGKTLGAVSVSDPRNHFAPLQEAPLLACERIALGDSAGLRRAISAETAAVILEPIQGEGGVRIPPPNWLKEVRQVCDQFGALLIFDEVQTGLGRTGKIFACEWEGVTPDLLTLGKALGGGLLPMGAVIGTREAFYPLLENPLFHSSTFGGNPLACAVALAALALLLKNQLHDNALQRGGDLLERLHELQEEYPDFIQEVRGRGLLIGLEMKRASFSGALVSLLRREGILVCHTLNDPQVIRLEPPLLVTQTIVDFFLDHLQRALAEMRGIFSQDSEREREATGTHSAL